MLPTILAAAIHYLALGIGLTGVRIRGRGFHSGELDPSRLLMFAKINTVELGLVMLIPFVASAMARGWTLC